MVDRLNKLIVAKNSSSNKDVDDDVSQEEVPAELFYYHGRTPVPMNKARGSESAGFVSDASYVRAALIVLLQHSFVKVTKGTGGNNSGDSSGSGSNSKESKKKKMYKQKDVRYPSKRSRAMIQQHPNNKYRIHPHHIHIIHIPFHVTRHDYYQGIHDTLNMHRVHLIIIILILLPVKLWNVYCSMDG